MTFGLEVNDLPPEILDLIGEPPAYMRLEPQSVSGDPRPGVAACVHDPLWMLLRQWQFGEFEGDDAGQPLSARIVSTSTPITAMAAGKPQGAVNAIGVNKASFLDPMFEAEPNPAPAGLRARAEAGRALAAAFSEAGAGVDLAALYPFSAADRSLATGVLRTLIAYAPDGEAAAVALEADGEPAWLAAAPAEALEAAETWLDWYRASVSPIEGGKAWVRERLEYRFAVATGEGPAQQVFVTPAHLGGEIDWYGFDLASGVSLNSPQQQVGAPLKGRFSRRGAGPPKPVARTAEALVAPLRYGGMPADRLWEFEDATVSFGAMDVQANDPARLCLIEFATIYGGDWFISPIDAPGAGFTTVDAVEVTDSFGVVTAVPRANDDGKAGRFRLYEMSRVGEDASLAGVLTLPTARATLEGPALERVHFLRDEASNMAWAVEETVQGPDGETRSRDTDMPATAKPPPLAEGIDLRYSLQSETPLNWIPLAPIATAPAQGGFVLRKATLTGQDDSRGRILAGKPVDFFDEEVTAGGLRVSRVTCLARGPDGTPNRWIAIRTSEAHGGVSSPLVSDEASAS